MIDLIQQLGAEVVLVVKHYLGSINHTLLSLEALYSRNISIKALIFNGEPNESSEEVIKNFAKCKPLYIPNINDITKENIASIKIDL